MTMKSDGNFEEKLTLGSKRNIRNLVNFGPNNQISQNFSSMDYFWEKRLDLKKCREVVFHDTEQ